MGRVIRGCAVALVGLVLLAMIAYVVRGITGASRLSSRQAEARAIVTAGLDQRDGVVAGRDAIRPLLTALGEPVRSWSAVQCVIGHHDSGWIVSSYYQACSVVAVDLYPTDDRTAAEAAAAVGATIPHSSDCRTTLELPVSAPSLSVEWVAAAPAEAWCGPPEPDRDPRVSGPQATGSVETTADAQTPTDGYVVVEARFELPEADLGCSSWGIVFCGQPIDEPVLDGSG